MNTEQLQKNLEYYIAHQDDFVSRYAGKALVFHQQKLFGAFDTAADAYFAVKDKFDEGTFSIINCSPGENAYTVNYRTVHRFSPMVPA